MNTTTKIILSITGFIILLFLLLGIRYLLLPVNKFASQLGMTEGVISKTYNSDNAIYNYEWFKQTNEDIKALENKIKIASNELKDFEASVNMDRNTWSYELQNEYNYLKTIKLGLLNQYEDIVAKYNARAKMANRNIFQNDLPTFINVNPF